MDYSLLLNESYASHKRLVALLQRIYASGDPSKKDEAGMTLERFLAIFDLMVERELLKTALESPNRKTSLAYLRAMSSFSFDILGYAMKFTALREIKLACDYDSVLNMTQEEREWLLCSLDLGLRPLWEDVKALVATATLDKEELQNELFQYGNCFLLADPDAGEIQTRILHERIRCHIIGRLG